MESGDQGRCAHLPPAPLAVLGALNDPRQIQQLDFGASIAHHTGDAGQGGELIRRHLRIKAVHSEHETHL